MPGILAGTGYSGHRRIDHAALLTVRELLGSLSILLDCGANVGQSLLFGGTLRPAAGQSGAGNAKDLFGAMKNNTTARHADIVSPSR